MSHNQYLQAQLSFQRCITYTTVMILLTLCSLSGCVRTVQPRTTMLPSAELRLHTVTYSGENLSIIARWYTGEAKNWRQIQTYNGHLKSPSFLSSGDIIRIPIEIMTRTDPMTSEFVAEQQAIIRRAREKLARSIPAPLHNQNKPSTEDVEEESAHSEALSQDQLIENLLSDQ